MEISDIIVDVPAWKWGLALAVTLGLTLLRYYKKKKWLLSFLRLSALAILCFLLLEPLLRSITSEIEPSTVVVLHDISSSQWMGPDSASRKQALNGLLTDMHFHFDEVGFEVALFDFSNNLSPRANSSTAPSLNGARTDISSALEGVKNKFDHRNVCAVIVSTDGLCNTGRDPEYNTQLLDVPHFFIGTGDTTSIKDVELSKLLSNQVTYLNNEFPVEIRLSSFGFIGKIARLKVYLDEELVKSENIHISDERGFYKFKYNFKALTAGVKKIRAVVIPIEGEVRKENNSATAYVNVLDSKRKIAIVASAPHPDVRALKNAMEENLHQEVNVVFVSEINKLENKTAISDCDVAIFHNIPNLIKTTPKAVFSLMNSSTPILFVGGAGLDLKHLPVERSGINFITGKGTQEISGLLEESFSLFETPDQLENELKYLPPVIAPMGRIDGVKSLNTLISSRLGSLETEMPLLAFNKDATGRRSGIFIGEGIWRWRIESSIKNGNSEVFDQLMNNCIKYLDSRDDVRRFRVVAPKKLDEDIRLSFSAQVYDAALNPTTGVDVGLALTNSNGEVFNYDFSIENDSYKLDCGRLSNGQYTWEASTILDGKLERLKGALVISEVKAELLAQAANHNLLRRISNNTDGDFLGEVGIMYSHEMGAEFANKVKEKVNKRDLIHEFTERLELINFNFILWLLLGLLTLEWVIRRRSGGF